MLENDTICALSTAPGMGAIAVLRISGNRAFDLTAPLLSRPQRLLEAVSHTAFLGQIQTKGEMLDEVLITPFRAPHSYTGEDVVEIACHGSVYIQQRMLEVFQSAGIRLAKPGEFTLRAFANGRMDLLQAEAVADLIASENEASHRLATRQMRGGFSNEIKELREQLIHFASLVELELDFAEEDVEFADRTQLKELLERIRLVLERLLSSFSLGNVIRNGFPVAIAGAPNAGKSTLLNAILKEERALVSEIAGTTRDTVEDEITLDGIKYRFIDTAGLRSTEDVVEKMGIERAYSKFNEAELILHLFDGRRSLNELEAEHRSFEDKSLHGKIALVINKTDLLREAEKEVLRKARPEAVFLSAKEQSGMEDLLALLARQVDRAQWSGQQTIVTNARHVNALRNALEALIQVQSGLSSGLSGELVAMDIRQVLFHLGELTGEISTDDLLGSIFSKFCIGK